ncbi:MAG: signal peptidase II [Thermodesulfatator sp.]|nr:MAG: signal peptidase II [Thermodesulfatator sp.]
MVHENSRKSGLAAFFIIAITVLVLDQLSKNLVISRFFLHESVPVIPGFFSLTYIRNTGAAFGILAGQEAWRHIFFQTVSLLALGAIVYLFWTSRRDALALWGASLVFGGAAGNLIDRIRFGYVVDFLDFFLGRYHWPAFNIADSAITIGAFVLAFKFLREQ